MINNYTIDSRAGDPNLGNVRVDDNVLFETGSAKIAPAFEPLLNQALALMTIRPAMTMTVIGHTDSRGDEVDNLRLSFDRAQAVVVWLVERGIDPTGSQPKAGAKACPSRQTTLPRAEIRTGGSSYSCRMSWPQD